MSNVAISGNASGTGVFTIQSPNSNTDRVLTLPDSTGTMLNDQSDIAAQVKTAANASGSAPIYACRAWVNFNGNGTVAIRASGNVSSITDNNTGDYTVNFTTAMPDANYAVIPGPADWTTLGVSSASDATTSSVRLLGRRPDNSAAQDREIVAVSIFR